MSIIEAKKRYEKYQNKINQEGYSFDIYKYNIYELINVKSIPEFLTKYEIMVNDGRNVIELDRLILESNFQLRKRDTSLDQLKEEVWRTVGDYSESELDTILEEND